MFASKDIPVCENDEEGGGGLHICLNRGGIGVVVLVFVSCIH